MRENILKNLLNLRNKLLIKNIFNLIEFAMCNLSKFFNYENKIFSNFQVFSNGKLISRLRIEKSKKLDHQSSVKRYESLKKIFKNKVGLLHGALDKDEKNDILEKFLNKKIDILVSTTVIEVELIFQMQI